MTNQDERTLIAGLRALKEQSGADGAPERLHAAVMNEFRNRRRRPRIWSWWIGATAAAVACTGLIVFAIQGRRALEQPATAEARRNPVLPPFERIESNPIEPATAQVHRRIQRSRAVRPGARPEQDVATDFIPLVSAPPLVRGEYAAVMRVELPRSSLRAFGFPVTEEQRYQRVNADVVVGQDGLIRAVRFVR